MTGVDPGRAQSMILIDELVRCGLKHLVIAPGSRSAPMALAAVDDGRIEVAVAIDERSAGFFALGVVKASGVPAAVLTTSGTAAANLLPAAVEADLSRTPLLMLTADRPVELRSTGAGQTIDQTKMFGGVVRLFTDVGVAEDRSDSVRYWRSVADRCWAASLMPVPGPVHVNLPFREPLVPSGDEATFRFDLEGRADGAPWTGLTQPVRALSDEDVASLAARMSRSDRGLILAGDACDAPDAIAALASSVGWPLIAQAHSGARRGPNAISTYDALLRSSAFAGAHRPDFVLRFGSMGTSKALASWISEAEQIWVDPHAGWLDPARVSTRLLACDAAVLIEALIKLLPADAKVSEWLSSWRAAESAARVLLDSELDRGNDPSEPRTARDLARWLPDGSALVVSSSMPIRDLDWFMEPRDGVEFFANRGANGIDGLVSTARGVAAVRKTVFVLIGDLALLHDQNGLLTRTQSPSDVVFVVLNNNGGGIFSFLPQAEYPNFERLFTTPHDVDLADLARSHRCGYVAAGTSSGLREALETASSEGGIQIVEVTTDTEENLELHRRIWSVVEDGIAQTDSASTIA